MERGVVTDSVLIQFEQIYIPMVRMAVYVLIKFRHVSQTTSNSISIGKLINSISKEWKRKNSNHCRNRDRAKRCGCIIDGVVGAIVGDGKKTVICLNKSDISSSHKRWEKYIDVNEVVSKQEL